MSKEEKNNFMVRLKDKTAVITGGAGDLGQGMALKFADEGADLVVNDLSFMAAEDVCEKVKEKGRKALPFQGDVTDFPAMERLFAETIKRFGKVDILVCSAGLRQDTDIGSLSGSQWQAVIDTFLKGCFNCVKAAQKYMVERRSGKILIMASPVPPGLGRPGNADYSAANAGLMGLTVSLAIELGAYNINVNCLAPDFIQTRMTRESLKKEGLFLEDFKKAVPAHIPLRRLGTVEDVSNAALFLVSDESAYISGQVIKVRGGP
jgi:3-oxoacyl-[acyl-carrier protein] reductase